MTGNQKREIDALSILDKWDYYRRCRLALEGYPQWLKLLEAKPEANTEIICLSRIEMAQAERDIDYLRQILGDDKQMEAEIQENIDLWIQVMCRDE